MQCNAMQVFDESCLFSCTLFLDWQVALRFLFSVLYIHGYVVSIADAHAFSNCVSGLVSVR